MNLEIEIAELRAEHGEATNDNREALCLAMAKLYISMGMSVAPIAYGIAPDGKKLPPRWAKGKAVFTDYESFEIDFLQRTPQQAGQGYEWWIGIATGYTFPEDAPNERRPTIVVVDVDVKSGDGVETLTNLLAKADLEISELATLTARTKSGGFHYYFSVDAAPFEYRRQIESWPSVDFISDKGYVVAYPSPGYEFVNFGDIKPLPDCLRPPVANLPQPLIRGLENDSPSDMHPVRKMFNDNRDLSDLLEEQGYVYLESTRNGLRYNPPTRGTSRGEVHEASTYIIEATDKHPYPIFWTFHDNNDPLRLMNGADAFAVYAFTIGLAKSLDEVRDNFGECVNAAREWLEGQDLKAPETGGLGFAPTLSTKGGILATAHNYTRLFESPLFVEEVGYLHEDRFRGRTLLRGRELSDAMVTGVRVWNDIQGWPKLGKDMAYECLDFVAEKRASDPLLDYFESLPAWDGRDRITELVDLIALQPTDLHRMMFRKWLIGGVMRALTTDSEGCDFQQMLILHGAQGVGKSRLLRSLCPDPSWFLDDLGSGVVSGFGKRDEIEKLRGIFICEIAELSAFKGGRRDTNDEIKSFLSVRKDRFRKAYGRSSADYPRRCIFAGTTNQYNFLADPTGARRFWIISVGSDEIDTDLVLQQREQIWSQAKDAYLKGENPYTTRDQLVHIEKLNKNYETYGDNYNDIRDWAQYRSCFAMQDLCSEALEISSEQFLSGTFNAARSEVRATLTSLGYEFKSVRKLKGKKVFVNPDKETHEAWVDRLASSGARGFGEYEGRNNLVRDIIRARSERQ